MRARWHTSLRLRLLLLTAVVAVAAAGVTAWLTVYQADQQAVSEAKIRDETVRTIQEELVAYGALHGGSWDGVTGMVRALRDRTGQRIQLGTMYGKVVADSDTLDGGSPRPVGRETPVLIDPVPTPAASVRDFRMLGYGTTAPPTTTAPVPPVSTTPNPPPNIPPGVIIERLKTGAILGHNGDNFTARLFNYRLDAQTASCLNSRGFLVEQQARPDGVPWINLTGEQADGPRNKALAECRAYNRLDSAGIGALLKCLDLPKPDADRETCVRKAFRESVQEIMPEPLVLHLGVGSTPAPRGVPLLPALLAAAGVALVAVLGMWLVSRRVLRPVGALTAASTRLGAGDLRERVPVRGRDEIAHLAGAFNRMAEKLQRSEERQRRMIADIAHELRTPLANIRGYLEALRDGVLPPDPELFASLHEEAVLQQRLIEDIQTLALADAGSLAYERLPVDLAEVVEATRTGQAAVASAAGVTVVTSVADPVPVVVGDEKRLRQVLGNLVGNAIRHTPEGGVVTIAARAGDGQAVVTVSDTGHGIREEDLPFVFDRFWRADDARARTTGGSGLGLSIAREIVLAHGGTITADSPDGAVFTVRLPVQD
ncbi:two-component system sensor histidine kinase BaeS [Crossiella equi]|uniref:histidine kinase n=1 Tax=Crossiella equi TaxID=130796 RepID=A0ABS5ACT1_9PSEU|nr:ATP-binding protein [Crossiella equi]MBP2474374.1 two-component system sensor histidine kinase BaeS [Crossiella equi]